MRHARQQDAVKEEVVTKAAVKHAARMEDEEEERRVRVRPNAVAVHNGAQSTFGVVEEFQKNAAGAAATRAAAAE